jgi:hypothetical protein
MIENTSRHRVLANDKGPTFSDAIAIVRLCLWGGRHFSTSSPNSDVVKVLRSLLERLIDAVCYAA